MLSVTGTATARTAAGSRHFGEVARAGDGAPIVVYNIPRRATSTPRSCSPSSLRSTASKACKQSNGAELQPIDGMSLLAGNDDALARCLDLGDAGGICVASHIVGPEMRR